MSASYILYKKGLLHSTDIFVHNAKICIRQNSSGGEYLMYVASDFEHTLFILLQSYSKNWRDFAISNKETNSEKKNILILLAEKFANTNNDPFDDIKQFFKANQIKYTTSYWPDSDRF